MDREAAAVDAAAATAGLIESRTGLSPTAAAIVAILHAISHGRWPRAPWRELVAGANQVDVGIVERELDALARLGIVRFDGHEPALSDVATRALDGTPELGAAVVFALGRSVSIAELADVLATPGGTVVLAGGVPADRLAALRHATTVMITLVDLAYEPAPELLADIARDAWMRGTPLAIEAGSGDLAWIDAVAPIPCRLAIAVDADAAGEALARLRIHREASLSMVRAAEHVGPRVPVPPALQPLVSTTWKGVHVDAPEHRIVALRAGDPIAAARAVAAGHGVELVRVDVATTRGIVRARDAFARHRVVWLDGTAALDPVAAGALAALVASATGIVLVADAELPAVLRASIEATIET